MKKYLVLLLLFLVGGYFFFFSSGVPDAEPNQIIHSGIIVALGDSLTEGTGVSESHSYPSLLKFRLEQEGYDHYTILNHGVSGDTTRDGLARLEDIFTETHPEIVIVALGANDALQRFPVQETQEYLRKILRIIQEYDAKILLVGILPPPTRGFSYISAFETMYENLAREFDAVLMPSLLSGVMMRSEYNLADNMHPNEKGYRIIAENLWPYLRILLREK
ncbi:arylesterase [Candidatus Gracilibacteria bacterium]|nr:arylesterase [Candidatus Gracilibacteria bacterium]MCF7819700.1 arylesterase [Candidatus Gracilibacteria bacterium]